MLAAPSSIVNNKNADVEVQTHDQITLSLDFLLIRMLSGIFSCRPSLRRLGSRCYISFTTLKVFCKVVKVAHVKQTSVAFV